WHQVVAGTRPAQPYWTFLDRHLANPRTYPLATAQAQYLAQPRVASMLTYNALPNKVMALPTSHLEAFQTGLQGYSYYGWLCAVPGDAVVCLDGTYLAADNDRHATQIAYLAEANRHITALAGPDNLVACCTR
ncbi:hypothetical protein ABZS66_61490, partial [Dactylosporangium sp. NPDC005572]